MVRQVTQLELEHTDLERRSECGTMFLQRGKKEEDNYVIRIGGSPSNSVRLGEY